MQSRAYSKWPTPAIEFPEELKSEKTKEIRRARNYRRARATSPSCETEILCFEAVWCLRESWDLWLIEHCQSGLHTGLQSRGHVSRAPCINA